MLSASYTEEQAKLTEEIPVKETAIQRLRDTVSSTDGFIAKAKHWETGCAIGVRFVQASTDLFCVIFSTEDISRYAIAELVAETVPVRV